jgi:hypothetical protein
VGSPEAQRLRSASKSSCPSLCSPTWLSTPFILTHLAKVGARRQCQDPTVGDGIMAANIQGTQAGEQGDHAPEVSIIQARAGVRRGAQQ